MERGRTGPFNVFFLRSQGGNRGATPSYSVTTGLKSSLWRWTMAVSRKDAVRSDCIQRLGNAEKIVTSRAVTGREQTLASPEGAPAAFHISSNAGSCRRFRSMATAGWRGVADGRSQRLHPVAGFLPD